MREEDILHTGVEAFAAALNTVNVGKFNLCSCSIGMTEHAFYEAITHAQNRILYGNPVTEFTHVRTNFVDAYSRLIAMKLFSRAPWTTSAPRACRTGAICCSTP